MTDTVYGPVTDWATDFDHGAPEYNANIHQIWDDLKAAGCPIAHTERYGGVWLPLTHDLVKEIAYDPSRFSSLTPVVQQLKPSQARELDPDALGAPIGPVPPIPCRCTSHSLARVFAEADRPVAQGS